MNTEKQKQYFSASGLQSLKSNIDLVFAIGAEIKLLKKGLRFVGRCPFHDNKEPSLVISPKKNLWFCFGRCKKGGSIVDWVMAYENLKLIEALSVLAERYPFLAQRGQCGKLGLNEAMPETALADHSAVLQKIAEQYHCCLPNQPKAIRYLRSIGISQGLVKKFKIGFCDGSLVRSLIGSLEASSLQTLEELHGLGLLKLLPESGVKERFDNQIVFPLFDTSTGLSTGEKGQIIQLFGRTIPEKIKNTHVSLLVPSEVMVS